MKIEDFAFEIVGPEQDYIANQDLLLYNDTSSSTSSSTSLSLSTSTTNKIIIYIFIIITLFILGIYIILKFKL